MTLATELQAPPSARLSIDKVSKWFETSRGRVHALENVSLQVAEGQFVCLLGPSGCGKSTLLNMIAGLEMPEQGTLVAAGQPVKGPSRERMMMFQESALFPWLDAFGNVMFGLKRKPGLSDAERREVADYYLKLVGLEKFRHANIHELSGGMKQRVALARALAPNPRVLLMDEPFAALDAMTREQLYGDLQRIWRQRKVTIVFVTHNVREAVRLGDRILVLTSRPGRVAEEFTVDLPRPRNISGPEVAELAYTVTERLRAEVRRHADG